MPPRTLSFSSPARGITDSESLPAVAATTVFTGCFRKGSLRSSAADGRLLTSVQMHRSMNALTSGVETSLRPSGAWPCKRGAPLVKGWREMATRPRWAAAPSESAPR